MTHQPMIHNPLSASSAPDDAKVAVYWAGALLRRQFRAVLDGLEMSAKASGESFEWREQKGWLESSFSVRGLPEHHATIRRWAERANAS